MQQDRSTTGTKHFSSKTIDIKAGEAKQIALGSYMPTDPRPAFALSSQPELGEQLAYSLEQIGIPGSQKYILTYHIQNFSGKDCRVSVALASK